MKHNSAIILLGCLILVLLSMFLSCRDKDGDDNVSGNMEKENNQISSELEDTLKKVDARLVVLRLMTKTGPCLDPNEAMGICGANSVGFSYLIAADEELKPYINGVGIFIKHGDSGHVAPILDSKYWRRNDILFMELFSRDNNTLSNIRTLKDYIDSDYSYLMLVKGNDIVKIYLSPSIYPKFKISTLDGREMVVELPEFLKMDIRGFKADSVFTNELIYEYILYHFDENSIYAKSIYNILTGSEDASMLNTLSIGSNYSQFVSDLSSKIDKGTSMTIKGNTDQDYNKNIISNAHRFEITFGENGQTYIVRSILALGYQE